MRTISRALLLVLSAACGLPGAVVGPSSPASALEATTSPRPTLLSDITPNSPDFVIARHLPARRTATLRVDFSRDGTWDYTARQPIGGYGAVRFQLPARLTDRLRAGSLVRVSTTRANGTAIVIRTIAANLRVTGCDPVSDLIRGVAPVGRRVTVVVPDGSGEPPRATTVADWRGWWAIDFTGRIAGGILPTDRPIVSVRNSDGNTTQLYARPH